MCLSSSSMKIHALMTVNRFAPEEVETAGYRVIICVALIHIAMASSQMRSNEAEIRIIVVEPYSHSTFVSRHPAETSLISRTSGISLQCGIFLTHFVGSCLDVANDGG